MFCFWFILMKYLIFYLPTGGSGYYIITIRFVIFFGKIYQSGIDAIVFVCSRDLLLKILLSFVPDISFCLLKYLPHIIRGLFRVGRYNHFLSISFFIVLVQEQVEINIFNNLSTLSRIQVFRDK